MRLVIAVPAAEGRVRVFFEEALESWGFDVAVAEEDVDAGAVARADVTRCGVRLDRAAHEDAVRFKGVADCNHVAGLSYFRFRDWGIGVRCGRVMALEAEFVLPVARAGAAEFVIIVAVVGEVIGIGSLHRGAPTRGRAAPDAFRCKTGRRLRDAGAGTGQLRRPDAIGVGRRVGGGFIRAVEWVALEFGDEELEASAKLHQVVFAERGMGAGFGFRDAGVEQGSERSHDAHDDEQLDERKSAVSARSNAGAATVHCLLDRAGAKTHDRCRNSPAWIWARVGLEARWTSNVEGTFA